LFDILLGGFMREDGFYWCKIANWAVWAIFEYSNGCWYRSAHSVDVFWYDEDFHEIDERRIVREVE
jgi:hypothetical protein